MRRSTFTVAAAVAAVTLSALSAGVATAGEAPSRDEQGHGPSLKSGQAAIDSLGDRLPAAARRLDLPAAALRHILLTDSTAQLDSEGNLTFVEPTTANEHEAEAEATSSGEAAAAAAGPSYPLDQTFALHSKPGSSRVIYLDFTGYDLTGTVWSKPENGGLTGTYKGYSTDPDFTTFSDQELADVQRVWQHTAADFAALDVDVTTADPGAAALDRTSASDTTYGSTAFITSDPAVEQQVNCDCGGKAWYNAFDRQPDHHYCSPPSSWNRRWRRPTTSPRSSRARSGTLWGWPTTARSSTV